MHLVSHVIGKLYGELDTLHAYRAYLDMDTLVGAPRVHVMQLLRQYRDDCHGSYSDAIGILDSTSSLDTSIVVHLAEIREGIARIQAGTDMVPDLDLRLKTEETYNKTLVVLTAVVTAGREREKRDAHHAIG